VSTAHTPGVGASAPTPNGDTAPRLRIEGVSKHYGPVVAVVDASFDAYSGEVLALVGENGAGKSTLGKILAGAVEPTSGTISLNGDEFVVKSVGESRQRGVSCAFQELSLIPELTVAENLFLVDSHTFGRFSQKRAREEAADAFSRLGVHHISPGALVAQLPLADRQVIEIVRALLHDSDVLILDEASSALTPPGVEWLFTRIREYTATGGTVIYVSHRMPEIAEIAHRVLVLRDGNIVGEFAQGDWSEDQLVALMAGRDKSEELTKPITLPSLTDPVLSVRNLESPGIKIDSLDIFPGEIVGLGGLQGQGQAELLKALFGAAPSKAEAWMIDGVPVGKLTPPRAVKKGVGFVPEDRKTEGLVLNLGVGENLVTPWLRNFGIGGAPQLKQNQNWLGDILSALGVRTRGTKEMAGALSGGNQQKLVFGRWVNRDRKVLLLHDPTRGIDVGAKRDLYRSVFDIAQQGVAVLWLSTEVEELVNVCSRVIVMYQGRVVGEVTGDRLTSDAIVAYSMGMEKGNS
jgi:ribose transport system ATP-binding protein